MVENTVMRMQFLLVFQHVRSIAIAIAEPLWIRTHLPNAYSLYYHLEGMVSFVRRLWADQSIRLLLNPYSRQYVLDCTEKQMMLFRLFYY